MFFQNCLQCHRAIFPQSPGCRELGGGRSARRGATRDPWSRRPALRWHRRKHPVLQGRRLPPAGRLWAAGRPGRDGGHLGAGRWDAPRAGPASRGGGAGGAGGRGQDRDAGRCRSPAGENATATLGPPSWVRRVRGMSLTRKKGFYKQDVNKTAWELPKTYLAPAHVGSGAYGAVW